MARSVTPSRRRSRVILALAGAVLLATGGTLLAVAVTAQQPSPPAAAPGRTPPNQPSVTQPSMTQPPASTATRPRHRPPLALPASEPVSIGIPRLKVNSPLEQLELDANGAMQVPKDPAKAGWFTPSPAPGVIGRSVIAGHVTWNHRPAVFFRLAELRAGDRIDVRRQDGRTAVFTVESVGQFAKDKFPTGQVYGGSDHAALRLITCGGTYDEAAHRYLDNVVVSARLAQGSR
ncbi:class F sortase [Kribbella sp. NPDC004138]